jgi:fluoride exporter
MRGRTAGGNPVVSHGIPGHARLSASGAGAVALGGAVGALLRHGVAVGVLSLPGPAFPWGTLAANVLGALLLGVVDGRLSRPAASPRVRLFWATGVCGGFTTFSLFSWEVLLLFQDGRPGAGVGYAAASLLFSVGGIAAGSALVAAR